jgi:hypothetical protein
MDVLLIWCSLMSMDNLMLEHSPTITGMNPIRMIFEHEVDKHISDSSYDENVHGIMGSSNF